MVSIIYKKSSWFFLKLFVDWKRIFNFIVSISFKNQSYIDHISFRIVYFLTNRLSFNSFIVINNLIKLAILTLFSMISLY